MNEAESLFTYGPGESTDFFCDLLHMPPFLDETNISAAGIPAPCMGSVQCAYDVMFGNMSIGIGTADTISGNVNFAQVVGKNDMHDHYIIPV